MGSEAIGQDAAPRAEPRASVPTARRRAGGSGLPTPRPPDLRTPLTHWMVRRMLWSGRHPGLRGVPGRLLGRHWGSPIPGGAHLLVDDVTEYIQRNIVLDGIYEPVTSWILRALLRRHAGPFLDVGANVGLHSIVALSAGARVVAFEPVPRLAAHLRRNLLRNRAGARALVVPCAVGDRTASVPMYLATRADDGSHSLVRGVAASRIDEIQVSMVTLDQHGALGARGAPSVVKIDVEGFEARVLDGARQTLCGRKPPHLLIETGDRLAAEIGESAASVLARLTTLGYRLLRIHERPAGIVEVDLAEDHSALANYLAVPAWAPHPPHPPARLSTALPWIG